MKNHNVWMSVSDLMTGLMVIFLFIAISYMLEVQNNMSDLKEYVDNKTNMYERLKQTYKSEITNGTLIIKGDLSMRFQKAESLFDQGSWDLKDEFKKQLDEIMPRYLDILLTDSLSGKIKEIRIEGHTDDVPYPALDSDPYMANLILSQRRALSIMNYLRQMPYWTNQPESQKKKLEFWFTANGYSYGHSLDNNGQYSYLSHKDINRDHSRRVEIRIITTGEEILEKIISED